MAASCLLHGMAASQHGGFKPASRHGCFTAWRKHTSLAPAIKTTLTKCPEFTTTLTK